MYFCKEQILFTLFAYLFNINDIKLLVENLLDTHYSEINSIKYGMMLIFKSDKVYGPITT